MECKTVLYSSGGTLFKVPYLNEPQPSLAGSALKDLILNVTGVYKQALEPLHNWYKGT